MPNDTRKHVVSAIEEILDSPGRDIMIEVIYTDDFMKDHLVLKKPFKKGKLSVGISFHIQKI